jgi:hypothetical protein
MPIKTKVQRDAGHPWDGRPGFDLLHLLADTKMEMDAAVETAKTKFWQCWLIGTCETGSPGGLMYKPCGASAPWHDSLDHPHPGNTGTAAASTFG